MSGDALYSALQMFAFEPPHLGYPTPLSLEFARWGAAALSGLALVLVVFGRLRREGLVPWIRDF